MIYKGYAFPRIPWICFISTNSGHFFFASSKSNVLLKITSKKNITYFQFKSNVVYGFALLTSFSQKTFQKGLFKSRNSSQLQCNRKSFLLKSKATLFNLHKLAPNSISVNLLSTSADSSIL